MLPRPTVVTRTSAAVFGVVVLCSLAAVAGSAVSPTTGDSMASLTIEHDVTLSLEGVPADDTKRTVHLTMPDELAGSISVQSVSGSAPSADVTAAGSLVDGPDDDGVEETIAIDVRASGGGDAPVTLALSAVGTYPDAYNESIPAVRVTTGDARFTADRDDPIVESALTNTRLTGPTISNALFGVSTPDGVGVDSVSLSISGDAIPDATQPVPLERLPPMESDGVTVNPGQGQMEMHAEVANATAGQRVTMAVEPTGDAAVALDSISITPATSGGFTLDVVRAAEPMAGFPEMDTTGKEPMGYIDVQHSIDNAQISNASMVVRVAKSEIEARENVTAENVALYRHGQNGWSEGDTRYLGQTPNYHVYEVVTDRFSEWATAGKKPAFRITDTGLNVTAESIEVNDGVRVNVEITNEGEADGEYTTELRLNDVTVEQARVSVAAGGTTRVNFERQLQRATTYEVAVNDVVVDQIRVEGSQEDVGSGSDSEGGLSTLLIAGGVLAVLALLGGGLYAVRNRRGEVE